MIRITCQLVPQLDTVHETVWRCVPEQHIESFKVPVVAYRPETRTVMVRVPTVREERRSETVPVTTVRPRTETYTVRVPECIPEERIERYKVQVCVPRAETRTVAVRVPTTRQETRTETVPVTTLRPETKTYTVRVPVPHTEAETYTVPVREWVPRTETYTARVPECRPETRTRKVAVTTYKTVREIVTERVPYANCVQVPYQVKTGVPAFASDNCHAEPPAGPEPEAAKGTAEAGRSELPPLCGGRGDQNVRRTPGPNSLPLDESTQVERLGPPEEENN
jgi:hypothetical protein